jgi:polar amino acid transport system permease protein
MTELAYAARTVAGASARYWEPYLTISVMYWVMTLALAYGISRLEKRLGKGD